jgi:hypothetical protein
MKKVKDAVIRTRLVKVKNTGRLLKATVDFALQEQEKKIARKASKGR